MPSHTLLSVVLIASVDWTSAHTDLKGKTAKKEEIHTDKKGDSCDFDPGSLPDILPAKILPCMLSASGTSSGWHCASSEPNSPRPRPAMSSLF